MRIALDLSPAVHGNAGIGRYAQALATALMQIDQTNQYLGVYTAPRGERPEPPLDRWRALPLRVTPRAFRLRVIGAYMAGRAMDSQLGGAYLFHATDHVLPFLRRTRSVFTIHDLTALLFPQWHLRLNRFFLQLMLPGFMQRAGAIIADSASTKRDVIARLRVPADKIEVVHLAADPSFCVISDVATRERVRNAYALPESFFLYLGTIEPRKNLVVLVDAYRDVVSHCAGAPDLVLAGKPGWQHVPVVQRVRELGLQQRVHFTGWVPAQDAPVLINLAHAFAYPSLYEGFGLPPLEAMQCGTPVICSNASSLPEVVGDAGLLIDPRDTTDLGRAMMRLWCEPVLRETLRARGLAQAATFSWQRTASATLAVYERAVRQAAYAHA